MPKNSKNSTQTDSKDKETETKSEGSVNIQYEAFRKMITHTLRFANESKEEDQQVLGLCIGEYFKENKSYIRDWPYFWPINPI